MRNYDPECHLKPFFDQPSAGLVFIPACLDSLFRLHFDLSAAEGSLRYPVFPERFEQFRKVLREEGFPEISSSLPQREDLAQDFRKVAYSLSETLEHIRKELLGVQGVVTSLRGRRAKEVDIAAAQRALDAIEAAAAPLPELAEASLSAQAAFKVLIAGHVPEHLISVDFDPARTDDFRVIFRDAGYRRSARRWLIRREELPIFAAWRDFGRQVNPPALPFDEAELADLRRITREMLAIIRKPLPEPPYAEELRAGIEQHQARADQAISIALRIAPISVAAMEIFERYQRQRYH